jgi:hypothetical protein
MKIENVPEKLTKSNDLPKSNQDKCKVSNLDFQESTAKPGGWPPCRGL